MTPAEAAADTAIKPCPFCGNSEMGDMEICGASPIFNRFIVRCEHCLSQGPPGSTGDYAARQWSTRHPEPAPEPSTTLPTEPGLYWWRLSERDDWTLLKSEFDSRTIQLRFKAVYPVGVIESLPVQWFEQRGGQWLPCLPPEREVQG